MQRGSHRLARSLLVAWLSLLSSEVARADDLDRIALQAEVPADSGCSDEATLRARLANDRDQGTALAPAEDQSASRRIRVRYTSIEREAGWSAHLTLEESATGRVVGERVVSAQGACAQLDDLVSVVISTLLGLHHQEADSARDEPLAEPEPEREPVPETSATDGALDRDAANGAAHTDEPLPSERARELKLYAGLGVLAGVGALPGAGFGVEGSVQLRWRSLLIVLGAQALPRASQDLGDGAQARFSAWLGRVQACGEVARGQQVGLALCLGGRAGSLHAQTRGLARNRTTTSLLGELLLGLRLAAQRTERLGFYGEVLATLPLRASRFYFVEGDRSERLYHQSEAGVMGSVGLVLRIGD